MSRIFMDVETGVVVTGDQAKHKLKTTLVAASEYDGRFRYKDVWEIFPSSIYPRQHTVNAYSSVRRRKRLLGFRRRSK